MYYYHLNITLYTLEPIDLPSSIFIKLPDQLVQQDTLDLFDVYYQQFAYTPSCPATQEPTDSLGRHHLYPRKRQPEKSPNRYPKPDVPPTPPDISDLHQHGTSSITTNSTPTAASTSATTPTTPTTIIADATHNDNDNEVCSIANAKNDNTNDDFRLGPLDIECIDKLTNDTTVPEQHCKLGYGIVHLYRDEGPAPDDLMPDMLSVIDHPDDIGSVVCTLAVPSYMTTRDFLNFVKPFDDTIIQYRFIRDAAPNKYMVLMKFKDVQSAYLYHCKFNGRQFHGLEPELCHIVFIASTTWNANTIKHHYQGQPRYPMLKDTLDFEREQPVVPHTMELPTCPVCLERMDENVTGLLGIMCQHSFDCFCLGKWGEGNCHICRFSEKPVLEGVIRDSTLAEASSAGVPRRNHQGWLLSRHANDNRLRCYVCGEVNSLWICMICGHIGCGRYQEAHAYDHYMETRHLYALEIDTQRVWDYVGDGYVHRLIQNTVDGKLVEFPGATPRHDPWDGKAVPSSSSSASQQQHSDKVSRLHTSDTSTHIENRTNGNGGASSGNDGGGSSSSTSNKRESNNETMQPEDEYSQAANSVSESSISVSINKATSSKTAKSVSSSSSSSMTTLPMKLTTGSTKCGNDDQSCQQEKLEAMSMEYTTLLTSQLESQRIYYEDQLSALVKQLSKLTAQKSHMETQLHQELDERQVLMAQYQDMNGEYESVKQTNASLQSECQSWKNQYELARSTWEQEKKVTNTLSTNNEELKNTLQSKRMMAKELQDELRDLMFFMEARNKVQDNPDMAGGSVGTVQKTGNNRNNKNRRGNKGKR